MLTLIIPLRKSIWNFDERVFEGKEAYKPQRRDVSKQRHPSPRLPLAVDSHPRLGGPGSVIPVHDVIITTRWPFLMGFSWEDWGTLGRGSRRAVVSSWAAETGDTSDYQLLTMATCCLYL